MGITRSPEGLAAVFDAHACAICDSCGAESDALPAMIVVPWSELGPAVLETVRDMLAAARPQGEIPVCPECGASMGQARLQSCRFEPDEPGFPTLVWESSGEGARWSLGRAPLREAPSDDVLFPLWGRAWSVRSRWRATMGDAHTHPGVIRGAPLSPGLGTVVVVTTPQMQRDAETAPEVLMSQLGPELSEAARNAHGEEPGDPVILPLAGYPGVDGPDTWVGPWDDTLHDPGVMCLMVVDRDVVRATLEAMAGPLTDDEVVLDADTGVRVSVAEVYERAVGSGVTIAEAARLVLDHHEWFTGVMRAFLGRVREAAPEVIVDVRATDEVRLSVAPAAPALHMNAYSILSKHGFDPDSPGITRQLAQMVRLLETPPNPDVPICDCGREWALMHLRSEADAARLEGGAAVEEQVADALGHTFRMVATLECEHSLRYVLQPDLPDDAARAAYRRRLRQGPRSSRWQVRAQRAPDMFAQADGVVLSGSNIATLLVHPGLRERLRRALVQKGIHGDLVAFALTTDVVWVGPLEGGNVWDEMRALTRARRDRGVEYQGSPLGFITALEPSDASPQGTLHLDWV